MASAVFIHLDLGIGGAENLVVNAARGLQQHGYKVRIFTAHHDPMRAFRETTDGSLEVCHLSLHFRMYLGDSIWLMDSATVVRWVNDSSIDSPNDVGLFNDVLEQTNSRYRIHRSSKRCEPCCSCARTREEKARILLPLPRCFTMYRSLKQIEAALSSPIRHARTVYDWYVRYTAREQ